VWIWTLFAFVLKHLCLVRGTVFDLKDFQIKCPNCGAVTTEPVSGTELELEYVELEEP